ncbi:TIGR03619 family F420-dependent LLM class oxidoreductase [Conexibacter sp. CPCC 206217]|uniref:TIGR03619 family F420-dependent LLM class oxidoreductase n=1 Tax=Conexibacter sp. CPCC 206217 TaxID=3064574 RepID=UPI0027213AD6|nr:TIGR03619 family F420-dependent LLM class oxidoreductase [Conexibacter sp. CPCC 206217]MDO8209610.1 TIGR03619 family F420-dependent LLM class oxidoreductase [Conexibacter sp. CPCC 206217]
MEPYGAEWWERIVLAHAWAEAYCLRNRSACAESAAKVPFRHQAAARARSIEVRMETAISYFASHEATGPGVLAALVEERGHVALHFAEHTHIPAGSTVAPDGRPLARKYLHTYDLFVALTAAAQATSRLRVGSGICLVAQRDPIITAKQVASVDHLSGGRMELGVGAGWNREEMANHGLDARVRMAVLREKVEAMKEIWSAEEASYQGEYVSFERILSWPKPVQRPHPPILVGGNGPTVLDRVLAFGDVWFPNNAIDELPRIAELRARAEAAGRRIPVYAMDAPADAAALERLRAAGVERAIHWVPSADRGQIERELDRFGAAVAELNGEA